MNLFFTWILMLHFFFLHSHLGQIISEHNRILFGNFTDRQQSFQRDFVAISMASFYSDVLINPLFGVGNDLGMIKRNVMLCCWERFAFSCDRKCEFYGSLKGRMLKSAHRLPHKTLRALCHVVGVAFDHRTSCVLCADLSFFLLN